MRAIIFGANGQLGTELARQCRERDYDALALGREETDISDAAAVRERIASHRPDVVINAAAYNGVDQAESDFMAALTINASAVRDMAAACAESGATLVHYSTDYAYGGDKRSPYVETDIPKPLSCYGASKAIGDAFIRDACPSHYVLRVAGVFSPAGRYTKQGNFPESVLRKCAEGSPMRIVRKHWTCPTYGPALASRTLDIVARGIPHGLYHLAGSESISWYDFACKVAAAAGCEADISPIDKHEYPATARRPRKPILSNAKAEAAGIEPLPALDDALREYMVLRERERPPD